MWKRIALSLFTATLVGFSVTLSAQATDLPAGVTNYLMTKDPNVKIRFDGLVIFSNGESYMPVIPQDPSLAANPQQVIRTIPEDKPFPDFIEFDNHFFLMRLVQTQSGRLTFPKLAEYPIELKEGLLPQDLVLPNNLFIPVELKVILGALPYNPKFVPADASPVPAAIELSQVKAPVTTVKTGPNAGKPLNSNIYLFDLSNQKVVSVDPASGRLTNELPLDCVPSSLRMSPDGKLLFASCLATNELVAIDTAANLVKTRIPVGTRPESILYLAPSNQVLVSHRFSDFLSTVGTDDLLPAAQIKLPGNGGTMAADSKAEFVYVADIFKPSIYQVNMTTKTVEKTLPAVANVSAMLVVPNASGRNELWVASRSQHQVLVIDPENGTVLQTFKVGEKPVDLAYDGEKVYVVSAKDARLDIIDLKAKALMAPIALPPESFPSDIAIVQPEHRAYISTAGTENLYVVDLTNGKVGSTLPLAFRSTAVTMIETEPVPLVQKVEPQTPVLTESEKSPGVLQADKAVPAVGKQDEKTAAGADPNAAKPKKNKRSRKEKTPEPAKTTETPKPVTAPKMPEAAKTVAAPKVIEKPKTVETKQPESKSSGTLSEKSAPTTATTEKTLPLNPAVQPASTVK